LVVCDETPRDMPEALRSAGSFAWELADEHPDAFGLPWADPDTGAVELRVVGPVAEPFILAWQAGTATRGGPGGKTRTLPRPEVPLRRVTVHRTVAALTSLMNARAGEGSTRP